MSRKYHMAFNSAWSPFLIVWTISWHLIAWRIALVLECMRNMVILTMIKPVLENKQLQSNSARSAFFEHLCSTKEWWRHDDESYSWPIKNESLNQHLTTAKKESSKIVGSERNRCFKILRLFSREFCYGYSILNGKSWKTDTTNFPKLLFYGLWDGPIPVKSCISDTFYWNRFVSSPKIVDWMSFLEIGWAHSSEVFQ